MSSFRPTERGGEGKKKEKGGGTEKIESHFCLLDLLFNLTVLQRGEGKIRDSLRKGWEYDDAYLSTSTASCCYFAKKGEEGKRKGKEVEDKMELEKGLESSLC